MYNILNLFFLEGGCSLTGVRKESFLYIIIIKRPENSKVNFMNYEIKAKSKFFFLRILQPNLEVLNLLFHFTRKFKELIKIKDYFF